MLYFRAKKQGIFLISTKRRVGKNEFYSLYPDL